MYDHPGAEPFSGKIQRLYTGILLLSWLVLGSGSLGVASEIHSLLQIEGDRITGVLTKVPLRTVLEQLHEKLAIEFVVPSQELDKPVSANLAGDSVRRALSKILSPWDFALQVDEKGRVHEIFVVAKVRPIEIEKNALKSSKSQIAVVSGAKDQPLPKTPMPKDLLPITEITSSLGREPKSPPSFLGTSEKVRPMLIQPAPKGTTMSIQPSSNFMQVIPASGYPPMDISPVSEDAQREFKAGHY